MRYLLTLMAVAALAACDGTGSGTLVNPGSLIGDGGIPSGGGSGVSCTYGTGSCEQLTGTVDTTQSADIESACTADGGSFSTGSCARTGTVAGYCGLGGFTFGSSGATGDFRKYYYSTSYDATTAEADCSGNGGTWVP